MVAENSCWEEHKTILNSSITCKGLDISSFESQLWYLAVASACFLETMSTPLSLCAQKSRMSTNKVHPVQFCREQAALFTLTKSVSFESTLPTSTWFASGNRLQENKVSMRKWKGLCSRNNDMSFSCRRGRVLESHEHDLLVMNSWIRSPSVVD